MAAPADEGWAQPDFMVAILPRAELFYHGVVFVVAHEAISDSVGLIVFDGSVDGIGDRVAKCFQHAIKIANVLLLNTCIGIFEVGIDDLVFRSRRLLCLITTRSDKCEHVFRNERISILNVR
jgi:hypothetical protein